MVLGSIAAIAFLLAQNSLEVDYQVVDVCVYFKEEKLQKIIRIVICRSAKYPLIARQTGVLATRITIG